jgi:protoheme IX farnesyltransferase
MGFLATVTNYWELTKPRIWSLLVFTGMAAMLVAYREAHLAISLPQLLVGFAALTLGSAAADVLTNYHDRDIDALMNRTKKRPIPSGRVTPRSALAFGLILAALSVVLAASFNLLSASFMMVGLLDNVVVYSLMLKRRSWLNIILGGISGGMPVLVGYSAVSGTVTPVAAFLAALVIIWIPTHIWSLAIHSKDDYARANVPMLPLVYGDRIGAFCIAITSGLLGVFSISIFLFTTVSLFYTISATLLGTWILAYSVKLAIDKRRETAWTLFKLSSPYLMLIFVALLLDLWIF